MDTFEKANCKWNKMKTDFNENENMKKTCMPFPPKTVKSPPLVVPLGYFSMPDQKENFYLTGSLRKNGLAVNF